jgi:hypothetical protein
VEHEVYRKGKLCRRWDYSKENGEVLVRKEIPARRVVARCRYIDLAHCHIKWWLDKVTGVPTQRNDILPTYRMAMRKLKEELSEDFLRHDVVISAQKMHSICLSREGTISRIKWETLYNIMLYGLRGEEVREVIVVPFMRSGHSSQTRSTSSDCGVTITSKRRWSLKIRIVFSRMFGRSGGVGSSRSYDTKANGGILD